MRLSPLLETRPRFSLPVAAEARAGSRSNAIRLVPAIPTGRANMAIASFSSTAADLLASTVPPPPIYRGFPLAHSLLPSCPKGSPKRPEFFRTGLFRRRRTKVGGVGRVRKRAGSA